MASIARNRRISPWNGGLNTGNIRFDVPVAKIWWRSACINSSRNINQNCTMIGVEEWTWQRILKISSNNNRFSELHRPNNGRSPSHNRLWTISNPLQPWSNRSRVIRNVWLTIATDAPFVIWLSLINRSKSPSTLIPLRWFERQSVEQNLKWRKIRRKTAPNCYV